MNKNALGKASTTRRSVKAATFPSYRIHSTFSFRLSLEGGPAQGPRRASERPGEVAQAGAVEAALFVGGSGSLVTSLASIRDW